MNLDYITYLFGMAGLKGNNNLVASSIQYVINVGMTIFALVFIDRWGRRLPLLVGSAFMAIWLFTNAGLMASYGHPAPPGGVGGVPEESWQISGAPAKAVIAATYLFVASYVFILTAYPYSRLISGLALRRRGVRYHGFST